MHLTGLHEGRREQAAVTKSSALLIDRLRKSTRHHDPCKKREMFICSDTPIPIRLSIKKSFELFRIVINAFQRVGWTCSANVLGSCRGFLLSGLIQHFLQLGIFSEVSPASLLPARDGTCRTMTGKRPTLQAFRYSCLRDFELLFFVSSPECFHIAYIRLFVKC